MAYASAQDMMDRYGEAELIRLTTPAGAEMLTIDGGKVERALGDASAFIDTWLRKRYAVPLAAPPLEISRAACVLARYELSHGEDREPGEQVRQARKEAVEWLGQIAAGKVLLDLDQVKAGDDSYAQASDRDDRGGDALFVTGWLGGGAWR